ncbi:hypothetical protein VZT92_023843 [Zoarces viviparus]|uniref:Uncharacterized protein n=1 Tax=Zoarces viviparus TaxID=48416 RepID=A0AAW1E8T3_ZOAVI
MSPSASNHSQKACNLQARRSKLPQTDAAWRSGGGPGCLLTASQRSRCFSARRQESRCRTPRLSDRRSLDLSSLFTRSRPESVTTAEGGSQTEQVDPGTPRACDE